MADFLPRRDAELLGWTQRFARVIAADPAAYGLSAEQAGAYQTLQSTFAQAYAKAMSGQTRGLLTVQLKDEARAKLSAQTRALARVVRAWPGITAVKKVELGLMPRPHERDGSGDLAAPKVRVQSPGRQVTVQVLDMTAGHPGRRRPTGSVGAAVYYALGERPASSLDRWSLAGNTTKPELTFVVPADAAPPGTPVHVVACWLDTRLQPGPISAPTSCHVGFEPMLRAA